MIKAKIVLFIVIIILLIVFLSGCSPTHNMIKARLVPSWKYYPIGNMVPKGIAIDTTNMTVYGIYDTASGLWFPQLIEWKIVEIEKKSDNHKKRKHENNNYPSSMGGNSDP